MRPIEASSTVAGIMVGTRCTLSPSTNRGKERRRNHEGKVRSKSRDDIIAGIINISRGDIIVREYEKIYFESVAISLINGPIKCLLTTAVSYLICATIDANQTCRQINEGETKSG